MRITSYAIRLRDPDNLFVKDAVDAVRHAGLIPDDSPEEITLEICAEVKVATKAEEKTVIEVFPPALP